MISIKVKNSVKKGWEVSPIKSLVNQSGQVKNKVGLEIVKYLMVQQEIPCTITKNNNIAFKSNYISEVRTSFASIDSKKKTFWFNQIRPEMNNWTHLHLVCVHPEKIEVYQYTKEETLELCKDAKGLDHIGQEGLIAINVNTEEDYWKLDCYGKFLGDLDTTEIKIINE